MIILNSPQAAFDLLDKRSKIYSDRPKSLVVDLYVSAVSLLALSHAIPCIDLLQSWVELEYTVVAIRRGVEAHTPCIYATLHTQGDAEAPTCNGTGIAPIPAPVAS